jgi:hypothetical protein
MIYMISGYDLQHPFSLQVVISLHVLLFLSHLPSLQQPESLLQTIPLSQQFKAVCKASSLRS